MEINELIELGRKLSGKRYGFPIIEQENTQPKPENNVDNFQQGNDVDKKTEVDAFTKSMKENGVFSNMKFNDIKIYSDYIEFSGEVPLKNNTIEWLVQKECTVKFKNPLIFGSIDNKANNATSYDIIDVYQVTNEINNTIKAIGEYYQGLKKRLPDYIGQDDLSSTPPAG